MNGLYAAAWYGSLLTGPALPHSRPAAPVQVIHVTGMDYALRVEDSVRAGRVSFRFRNAGTVRHELAIGLLKSGATVTQFIAARRAGKGAGQLIEQPVGVLFANPGRATEIGLGADMLAGRDYVLWCALADSDTAAEHAELGMFQGVHVASDPARLPTVVVADTVIATDYAFRLPTSLPAGKHSIAFRNAGAHRHELKIFALRAGQSLLDFMGERKRWQDDTSSTRSRLAPTPSLGVLVAVAGARPSGVFEVDMKPGTTYAFTCDFSDEPASPRHVTLGMFGSITVAGILARHRRGEP